MKSGLDADERLKHIPKPSLQSKEIMISVYDENNLLQLCGTRPNNHC